MLSFNYLGNLGRLSNQMFQYASLKGIASNRGFEFCIPPREAFGSIDTNVRMHNSCLYDIFDIESKNTLNITKNSQIREKSFSFDCDIFNNCPDDTDIFGYFQTEKYFKHIEDEIRNDFKFKGELVTLCQEFIEQNFDNSEVISLHIRRGDYTTNPNHPVQTIQYYEKALLEFEDLPVIVFSDDPKWCYNQKLFESDRFFISDNSYDFDLCLMSLCQYHVIANSSYSWWGSWLANSKKTIAPKNWFGGECSTHNTKDLYIKDWIIL